jgi:carboxymethylenebutenolidase
MRLASTTIFSNSSCFTREKSSHPKFRYVNLFSKYRICFRHPGLQRAIDRARLTHTDAVMTGEVVSLRAHDGHVLSAYQARPDKPPRGGLVLLQEIFGVTGHIRRVCDGYAAQGFHVVAPALFDRVRPGIELGYSKEDAAIGRDLRSKVPWDQVFADVIAAKAQLSGSGRIATLGYCWGGTIAWRSAVHVDGVAAAVCYYGTQIGPFIAEKPRCAVLMHFGESDPIATLDHAGQLRAAQGAQVEIQVYPASHGFNCDEIASFHQPSAALALRRSLEFLAAHVG